MILAAGAAFAVPAGAQFAGGRAAFDQRERPELVQFNDFFQPFWGREPYIATGATIRTIHSRSSGSSRTSRSSRRRRKKWNAAVRDRAGDRRSARRLARLRAEEALTDTPQIGIARRIKPYAGLVRYEQRANSPDWSQAVKEVLAAEKPSAIVVMLGINDRLPLCERIAPHPAPTGTQTRAGRCDSTQPAAGDGPAAAPEHDQQAAGGADAARKQTAPPPPTPVSVRVTSFTPTNGASFIPSASTR